MPLRAAVCQTAHVCEDGVPEMARKMLPVVYNMVQAYQALGRRGRGPLGEENGMEIPVV